jgi:hypothetical protein
LQACNSWFPPVEEYAESYVFSSYEPGFVAPVLAAQLVPGLAFRVVKRPPRAPVDAACPFVPTGGREQRRRSFLRFDIGLDATQKPGQRVDFLA